MRGDGMGSLIVDLLYNGDNNGDNHKKDNRNHPRGDSHKKKNHNHPRHHHRNHDIPNSRTIWKATGNQGDVWKHAEITFSSNTDYQVLIQQLFTRNIKINL